MKIEGSFIEEDSQTILTLDQDILAPYQAEMISPIQIYRRVSSNYLFFVSDLYFS